MAAYDQHAPGYSVTGVVDDANATGRYVKDLLVERSAVEGDEDIGQ